MHCSHQSWLQQAKLGLVYKPQGVSPALPPFNVHEEATNAGWLQLASHAAGLYWAATALHSAEQPLRKPIAMHNAPGDA